MTHDPLTQDEIYESLKDSLTGRIAKLSNFTDRSFNYVWTQAFAEEVRELQILAVVSEFAGWVDYVGGPITEDQLENLGLEDRLDADEINQYMEDEYLDEYVKIVGITRFGGSAATGTVTIDTQSSQTTIPEGTVVSTTPSEDGQTLRFETTEKAETADGVTTVTDISIEAVEVGAEHNVPANTIERFPDPPLGVRGVTNPESTTGGERGESNDELRKRAKEQVEGSSDGGTVQGIKSFIRQELDAVGQGDVILEEFTQNRPPFVDVIVDGGVESDVKDAIEFSRPAGIQHNLVRPRITQLGVRADLVGTEIDDTTIKNTIEDFLLDKGLNENFYSDELIKTIMNRDDDIENIDFLDVTYDRVTNESFSYSYDINAAIAEDGGVFTNETGQANDETIDDMTLLPQSPAVGDAYYFANDAEFSSFDINITTAGTGTWTVVWEYYDGSGWSSLTNVSDGTNGFQNGGVSTVSWDIPSDWVRETIGGEQHHYVRARLDSFSSISQQPLGTSVDITGKVHTLALTYEDVNGSIAVEDDDGTIYTQGTDYTMQDFTGDGWKETIVWDSSNNIPDDGASFSVDYDVTTASTTQEDRYPTKLERDEEFVFQESVIDDITYLSGQDLYQLTTVPFSGTTSISDASGDSYTEGTDYAVIDNTGNGFSQTIDWSIGGSSPDADETFTVTYQKKLYQSEYEITETRTGELEDNSGTVYEQDVDYEVVDYTNDDENDAISWLSNPSTLNDGESFYFEYLTEPDVINETREKIDPSTGRITVNIN